MMSLDMDGILAFEPPVCEDLIKGHKGYSSSRKCRNLNSEKTTKGKGGGHTIKKNGPTSFMKFFNKILSSFPSIYKDVLAWIL